MTNHCPYKGTAVAVDEVGVTECDVLIVVVSMALDVFETEDAVGSPAVEDEDVDEPPWPQ